MGNLVLKMIWFGPVKATAGGGGNQSSANLQQENVSADNSVWIINNVINIKTVLGKLDQLCPHACINAN